MLRKAPYPSPLLLIPTTPNHVLLFSSDMLLQAERDQTRRWLPQLNPQPHDVVAHPSYLAILTAIKQIRDEVEDGR